MAQEEIINEYEEKMCPYCKGKCNKGITIVEDESTIYAKCVDYEKDKSKIEGYKNPLIRTAKIQSCVIKGLVSDWNSI